MAAPRFNEQRVTDFLLGHPSPGDGAKLGGAGQISRVRRGFGGGGREGSCKRPERTWSGGGAALQ